MHFQALNRLSHRLRYSRASQASTCFFNLLAEFRYNANRQIARVHGNMTHNFKSPELVALQPESPYARFNNPIAQLVEYDSSIREFLEYNEVSPESLGLNLRLWGGELEGIAHQQGQFSELCEGRGPASNATSEVGSILQLWYHACMVAWALMGGKYQSQFMHVMQLHVTVFMPSLMDGF